MSSRRRQKCPRASSLEKQGKHHCAMQLFLTASAGRPADRPTGQASRRFSPRLETDLQYLMWQIACRHCRSGADEADRAGPGRAAARSSRRLSQMSAYCFEEQQSSTRDGAASMLLAAPATTIWLIALCIGTHSSGRPAGSTVRRHNAAVPACRRRRRIFSRAVRHSLWQLRSDQRP